MPNMTVPAGSLRRAILDVSPIAERAKYDHTSLHCVTVYIAGGSAALAATDRVVMLFSKLNVRTMSDKRRGAFTIDMDQVRMIRAYLVGINPTTTLTISVTNEWLTIDPDGNMPVRLRNRHDELCPPNILNIARMTYNSLKDKQTVTVTKFNAGLLSHMKDSYIIASGSESKPCMIKTNDDRAYGIIMPIRISDDGARKVAADALLEPVLLPHD